jgi:hypothetical protein
MVYLPEPELTAMLKPNNMQRNSYTADKKK